MKHSNCVTKALLGLGKVSLLGCEFDRLSPGVTKAVSNVNDIIAPALIKANLDVKDQKAIDKFLIDLDGTPNKCIFPDTPHVNREPNSERMPFSVCQWPAPVPQPQKKY